MIKNLVIAALAFSTYFGAVAQQTVNGSRNILGDLTVQGKFVPASCTFAAPPSPLTTGHECTFTDASSAGVCSGGGTAKSKCRYSGSTWEPIGGASAGVRNLNGPGMSAKCQAGLAAAAYSYTTAAPVPTCESDNIQAYLAFTANTEQTIYDRLTLPEDWRGTLKLFLSAYSTSTNAPTINVYLSCISTAAVASPTFGTAQAVSLTPAATSGRTTVTATLATDVARANKACAAGDLVEWKLVITAAAAADLRVMAVRFTE